MLARSVQALLVSLVCLPLYSQSGSVVLGTGYGFSTGTVYQPYSFDRTNAGHGFGLHVGAAWDSDPESRTHFRLRLLWQRYWWSESFLSHATVGEQTGFQYWEYEGSVDSRIDQLTATPFVVVPVRPKLRLLFGADLSIALASRVHDRTLTRYSSTWATGHTYIEYTDSSRVDSIGSGFKFVNEYQLAIPVGVEFDLTPVFRLSAEFSVGSGRLVEGRPPRYARLMISHAFARKRKTVPAVEK
jgi:hypothetical protein